MIYIRFWINKVFGPKLDLPRSDIIIPIEHIHGFDLEEPLEFKKTQYKDLWILVQNCCIPCKFPTIKIDSPTHISIAVILYKEGRYYVIARADQYPQFFDITSLFETLRPLVFKN